MLTGDQIKRARQAAGMSQADLAKEVGVSMRSIGNYERGDTVPRNKMPQIERALADQLGGPGPSLAAASDGELLAEIARRFERGHGHGTAITRGGGSPSEDPPAPGVTPLRPGDPEPPTQGEIDSGDVAAEPDRE